MTVESGEHEVNRAPETAPSRAKAPVVGRRALLRGASAAVPAILTLHSGAALARTSNLLGVAPDAAAEGGKYRCLDFDGIAPTENPRVFDLGEPPMAHVTRIDAEAKYYRLDPDASWGERIDRVTPQAMCQEGGTFYRKDTTWKPVKVQVKRGAMMSATAAASFVSGINYTDV
jgi:hypothetical protein